MTALGKLGREALACACLGYLAVALFHPGAKASALLVAGGMISAVVLAALLLSRPRTRTDEANGAALPHSVT